MPLDVDSPPHKTMNRTELKTIALFDKAEHLDDLYGQRYFQQQPADVESQVQPQPPQASCCIDVDECAECVKPITHSKFCYCLMLYPSFIGAILAVVFGSLDWNRHSDKEMLWSYYVFVIG